MSLQYQSSPGSDIHCLSYNGRAVITYVDADRKYIFQCKDLQKSFIPLIESWMNGSEINKRGRSFLKKCLFLINALAQK